MEIIMPLVDDVRRIRDTTTTTAWKQAEEKWTTILRAVASKGLSWYHHDAAISDIEFEYLKSQGFSVKRDSSQKEGNSWVDIRW
jgi:hypothetical protein